MTNDEIARRVDTTDEWIRERTGIVSRHIAAPQESVVDLATAAGAKALAAAGVDPAEVGLVLLATCSMPSSLPGGAAGVATRIGAMSAGAFDLNAACAGFCYGLAVAADAVRAGSATYVLVIGAEKLSDYVNWDDRGTCILFGDGAGAVVVGPAAEGEPDAIGPVAWGSDGDGADAIRIVEGYVAMDGAAVYRWATTKMAPVARRAAEMAGVRLADVAAFVPHQANLRIVESLARALQLPETTVVSRGVVDTGNTSAASVPIALARLVAGGHVAPGSPILLLGFGSGLTYAGQVVRCP